MREVITLLGRAAGVNVAFAEGAEGDSDSTVSLDIENESVDDVFNYVLRLSGLQANRVGQTVFVGKELPGDAQNRVVRSVRLNQMKATATVTTTRTLKSSAETGGSVSSGGDDSGSTTALTALDRSSDVSEEIEGKGAKEVLEAYGANESGDAVSTLLKGLSVVADARTNSVTLIGTPRKVEVATSLLTQLDVRQRQVAVNVQFIDVNLLKGKLSNTDVRYRANNGLGLGVTDGNFSLNLGNAADIAGNALSGGILGLTNNFLAALQVSIQNQNAKILTNPTLLIQEGSAAQVNLTEQIFSGTRVTDSNNGTSSGATTSTQAVEPIIQNAGVIMNVSVDRIDDNGFVTLNVSPEVSSLSNQTFVDAFGSTANLLQQRRVETGQIRVRDGQTLVMAGIIQDQDRVDITKVPVLGDIPLLGRLFRRTNNTKQRSELVVLITPQILNDSDQSTYGYDYNPSPEAEQLLRR